MGFSEFLAELSHHMLLRCMKSRVGVESSGTAACCERKTTFLD